MRLLGGLFALNAVLAGVNALFLICGFGGWVSSMSLVATLFACGYLVVFMVILRVLGSSNA